MQKKKKKKPYESISLIFGTVKPLLKQSKIRNIFYSFDDKLYNQFSKASNLTKGPVYYNEINARKNT